MDRMTLHGLFEGRFRALLQTTPNPREITAKTLADVALEVLNHTPAPAGCPDGLEEALGQPVADWTAANGPVTPETLAAALQLLAALGSVPADWHVGSAIKAGEIAVERLRVFQGHLETFHRQAKTLPGRVTT